MQNEVASVVPHVLNKQSLLEVLASGSRWSLRVTSPKFATPPRPVISGYKSRRPLQQALAAVTLAIALAVSISSYAADAKPLINGGFSTFAMPTSNEEHFSAHGLEKLFVASIEDLPPRDTYVSMRRIHYEPEVEISEQPIDGPKLLIVESGMLSIQTARTGTVILPADHVDVVMEELSPGRDYRMGEGSIILIPASVPVRLSNRSGASIRWLQIQMETPPTLCICVADLSGVRVDLLSSDTLPDPLAAPALLSLEAEGLPPHQAADSPDGNLVQLVAAVDDTIDGLSYGEDGTVRNDGDQPIDVYVFTVTSN